MLRLLMRRSVHVRKRRRKCKRGSNFQTEHWPSALWIKEDELTKEACRVIFFPSPLVSPLMLVSTFSSCQRPLFRSPGAAAAAVAPPAPAAFTGLKAGNWSITSHVQADPFLRFQTSSRLIYSEKTGEKPAVDFRPLRFQHRFGAEVAWRIQKNTLH